MKYRSAEKEDLPFIKEILKQNNLPYEDCYSHVDNFFVSEKEGKIIGVGGFEVCGSLGLVRSISVMPEYRGKGIAREIFNLLEGRAHNIGISTFYLLTETAVEYFMNLGFSIKRRAETPDVIIKTKQFSELCPSSALVMYRDITRVKKVK